MFSRTAGGAFGRKYSRMEDPTAEISPLSESSNEGAAVPAFESVYPVYRGNLIYLPFAAHLADEDAAQAA